MSARRQSAVNAEQILERDGYRCRRCGEQIRGERGIGWSIHHRLPRGMGGTRSASRNDPAYLLLLCGSGTTGCHGWVERNRAEAYESGYLLRHTTPATDPARVPVRALAFVSALLLAIATNVFAAPADSTRFHPPATIEVRSLQSRDEAIIGLGLLAAGIAGVAATHADDKITPRSATIAHRSVNWRFAAWGSVAATGFVLFSVSLPK